MSKRSYEGAGDAETPIQRRARLLNLQARQNAQASPLPITPRSKQSRTQQEFQNPHYDSPRERLVQSQRQLLSLYPGLDPVLSEGLMSAYMEVDEDEQDWSEALDIDNVTLEQQPPESAPETSALSDQWVPKKARTTRSIVPTQRANRLYGQWLSMLPQLVDERLFFERRSAQREEPDPAEFRCPTHRATRETLCIQFLRRLFLICPLTDRNPLTES